MFTLEKLQQKLAALTDKKKFLIAYSGGMDSHVLLHSLASLAEFKIRVVHINHGLSPNADKWARHCQDVCMELKVNCLVCHVDVTKNRGQHSLEAVARKLRYQQFARLLYADECLVAAHHANDQAETVLLQLLRGAGNRGLAAMPWRKDSLLRPLLDFSRAELHDYAQKEALQWIEDESNENIGFDRNFVRHKLLPVIMERWPGAITTLNRVAANCAATTDLLHEMAAKDYQRVQGRAKDTLSLSKLQQLTGERQSNVLRYWLLALQLPLPSKAKLEEVKRSVLGCRSDATPLVTWSDVEIRRYRDDLYAMLPLAPHDATLVIDYGVNDLRVCFRRGGECYQGRPLKKLLQEWGIPPWLRDRIPLVYDGDKLVFVAK